ncbi:molybdopterin oxidoreductase family protein [Microlunatus soli]|uniref:Assimilatory nitrate reductase (NADH) alpha subunit apoprotein n=1 Tax=Microlunatus soli TaxID=630515 RepID=A0A1H1VCH5_9ACTN|nr:molybdopterin oxidoreductase family protein [Microlunatus soli]SDS82106.1 assimilatory nitrate reductase (NADH) alpha subunit apoprotein [Microlunatus soli]
MAIDPAGSIAGEPLMVDTHCPYCALQCAMTLTRDADGEISVAGRDFPTNRGGLCRKGWTSPELLHRNDRLTRPLLRDAAGIPRPVSWDRAYQVIVDNICRTQQRYGNDAVAVFGGGGLTNEKAYLLGKFARVALRTAMVDYNGRFCMSSAAAAANRAFGVDRGLPFPVSDLDDANTIMLLGSNVADTMPPFTQHLTGAQRAGGLIVVDPRVSATARLTAGGSGVHLQPAPGTDLELLLGITHVVLTEGLINNDYLDRRANGLAGLRRSVADLWPERVQSITGVPAATIREIARRLAWAADNGGCYLLTGRGVEQHVNGTDTATAAINLALLLGLPGSPDSGYGTLTGQGNGQGGREHGQKSDQLPGYRKITDPAARRHVAAVWGIDPDRLPGPGLPAVQLLDRLGRPDGVRMLMVHGSNLVISAPDSTALERRLDDLDFLVVSDFFLSETARHADLILPVLQWAEEDGTMTTLEGRVVRRRAVSPPPGEAKSELEILHDLSRRLGAPSPFPTRPSEVFDELARASAGGVADYSGIDYPLLDSGATAHWPYVDAGTPRLFGERFGTADGRAELVPVRPTEPVDPVATGTGLTLITGRLLEHYQSGAQTRRVDTLNASAPRALVQIHPTTAAGLGIGDGDEVLVDSARGRARCWAELTTGIRPDTVFLPFHYPDRSTANRLTPAVADPTSGMPEFKTARVTVFRVAAIGAL